jgi:hypothetical protein
MKQLLAILITAIFATASVTAIAADKKVTTKAETKKVKKHKKAESTGKVADDKPSKPTPKKK